MKTYWHLEAARTKPTAYEIASSRLLYYVERGFEVRTPIAAWYAEHQTASPLQLADWELFRDPRETTYSVYVARQHEREIVIDGVLAATPMPPAPWLAAELLPILRYPVHGLQMLAAYVGSMAPSGKITIACAFQAGDELRRVQRFAYRMRQHQHVVETFGADARHAWQAAARWQPLRELVERALVTYDWGEAFTVLASIKEQFDDVFGVQLSARARASGDDALALVLSSLGEDAAWHRAWSEALVDVAIRERPENRDVIAAWRAKWAPLIERAFAPFREAV